MEKYYTIGEIYRKGLLLSHDKTPYGDKGTVARVVSKMSGVTEGVTPWGKAKMVPQSEIDKHNNKYGTWSTRCRSCGGDVGKCGCTLTEWYNGK